MEGQHTGDFMQRRFTERRVNANVTKSTVSMALANHETPFDVGIHPAFSEVLLHKVSTVWLCPVSQQGRRCTHPDEKSTNTSNTLTNFPWLSRKASFSVVWTPHTSCHWVSSIQGSSHSISPTMADFPVSQPEANSDGFPPYMKHAPTHPKQMSLSSPDHTSSLFQPWRPVPESERTSVVFSRRCVKLWDFPEPLSFTSCLSFNGAMSRFRHQSDRDISHLCIAVPYTRGKETLSNCKTCFVMQQVLHQSDRGDLTGYGGAIPHRWGSPIGPQHRAISVPTRPWRLGTGTVRYGAGRGSRSHDSGTVATWLGMAVPVSQYHHQKYKQEAVLKATAVQSPLPVMSPIPPCPPCLPGGVRGEGGSGVGGTWEGAGDIQSTLPYTALPHGASPQNGLRTISTEGFSCTPPARSHLSANRDPVAVPTPHLFQGRLKIGSELVLSWKPNITWRHQVQNAGTRSGGQVLGANIAVCEVPRNAQSLNKQDHF